ncbi:hypothetical protein P873_11250 [Arenimonas composti TR7-09 = DSM 18010]|uniref:Uncharacterized protein n=1 Tax=Arenimonas composti TR7-09 = DSM 18010 TaxID=1121013 RepID=A0A091BC65_9GAMM|nr:hypothetical protein P873_11250 [Arenimonas composti TR7-09 = DSM 18010]
MGGCRHRPAAAPEQGSRTMTQENQRTVAGNVDAGLLLADAAITRDSASSAR